MPFHLHAFYSAGMFVQSTNDAHCDTSLAAYVVEFTATREWFVVPF